jgi:hypothetical protein
MLLALTFEQALRYVPAQRSVTQSVSESPLIASGERVPTSWGHHPDSRREFSIRRPDRSWKRHRRLQRGSLRV